MELSTVKHSKSSKGTVSENAVGNRSKDILEAWETGVTLPSDGWLESFTNQTSWNQYVGKYF